MNPTKEINTTILMAVAMLTMFLNAFMGAALNIALPDISKEFALSAVEGSWVVMSFLLATAMFMVPSAKWPISMGVRNSSFGEISSSLWHLWAVRHQATDLCLLWPDLLKALEAP